MARDPRPRAQPSLLWNLWWLAPLAFALWFKEFSPMERTATPSLDESWHAIKAAELLNGTRLGVESIFTYGRLGWFYASCYVEELWNWKLWGFEIAFKGLLVLFCVRAVWLTPGFLTRLLFALALLVVPAGFDGFAFVATLALVRYLLEPGTRSWPGEMLALLLLVTIAMVKFTYALVFFLAIGLIALALMRSDSVRRGLIFLLRAALTFWFVWFALGQSLADLPAYVRTSWWVTQGYNDGMSLDGSRYELLLIWVLLAAAIGVVTLLGWKQRRDPRVVAMALIALLGAGMAYKAGFTRHMGNSMISFAVVPSATFFAFGCVQDLGSRLVRWSISAVRLGTICACALGYLHAIQLYQHGWEYYWYAYKDLCIGRWNTLTGLERVHEALKISDRRIKEHYRLPGVCKHVGREPIDVFDTGQSIAMLNGLNYAPRPVFQSYKTYMPELAAINAAHYAGPDAPRFVLHQIGIIDARLPMAAEGDTFELLLRRYRPVFIENGWLLLERNEGPAREVIREWALETTGRFDEWIDIGNVSGQSLRVSVDLKPTLAGKAWTFLVHGALVWGEFELDNQVRFNHRVVPRSLREGYLLRPHIISQEDVVKLFSGVAPPGVRRFRLVVVPRYSGHFEPEFRVRVERVEGLLPPPAEIPTLERQLGGFDPKPAQLGAAQPPNPVSYKGMEVMLMHAPSTARWDLQPGRYRLRGRFGLLSDAWASGCTDGAAFVVLTKDQPGQIREWMRRELLPGIREADREEQDLELEIALETPYSLYLRTTNGSAGNTACDWTYWADVRIERLD
jgi:hypothetical protein